jgi:hypothetical protein
MLQCLEKKAFGGLTVSALGDQNIDNVSILIHRPPQVVALASGCNKNFIALPDVPQSSLFPAQRSSIGRSKLDGPVSNCFV